MANVVLDYDIRRKSAADGNGIQMVHWTSTDTDCELEIVMKEDVDTLKNDWLTDNVRPSPYTFSQPVFIRLTFLRPLPFGKSTLSTPFSDEAQY